MVCLAFNQPNRWNRWGTQGVNLQLEGSKSLGDVASPTNTLDRLCMLIAWRNAVLRMILLDGSCPWNPVISWEVRVKRLGRLLMIVQVAAHLEGGNKHEANKNRNTASNFQGRLVRQTYNLEASVGCTWNASPFSTKHTSVAGPSIRGSTLAGLYRTQAPANNRNCLSCSG